MWQMAWMSLFYNHCASRIIDTFGSIASAINIGRWGERVRVMSSQLPRNAS